MVIRRTIIEVAGKAIMCISTTVAEHDSIAATTIRPKKPTHDENIIQNGLEVTHSYSSSVAAVLVPLFFHSAYYCTLSFAHRISVHSKSLTHSLILQRIL